MKLERICKSLTLLFVTTLATSCFAAPRYSITDLGSLGDIAIATDINNNGQVCGSSGTGANTYAFRWENGVMTKLPTNATRSGANSINSNGDVAGYTSNDWTSMSATIWHGTEERTVIAPTTWGYAMSWISDLNDSGDYVAIQRPYPSSDSYADNRSQAAYSDWNTSFGVGSSAASINNSGDVVVGYCVSHRGEQGNYYEVYQSFLYSNHTLSQLTDLCWATGINDTGQIIGYTGAVPYTDSPACLYDHGRISYIGSWEGWCRPQHLNNMGQVVGWLGSDVGGMKAFYWEDGELATDLNTLVDNNDGWILNQATSINDHGQIVGYGDYNGQRRAFLLTPTPEPSSIIALICGMSGFGMAALRRIRS